MSRDQPSPLRAWCFLVQTSTLRMLRGRQMVGIALGLLLVGCAVVLTVTARGGWDRPVRTSLKLPVESVLAVPGGLVQPAYEKAPWIPIHTAPGQPLAVFSRWVVFLVFLGFLFPLWTLSFAISALGAERENRSLIWLLTRPLPRGAIYLAKLAAVLPWCLAFNLGGFACLCLCGGSAGRACLELYAPAVVAGTVAFTALFHALGATVPRPAVVALVYAFFFETILSELPVPGTLKRLSINYYTRCLMYAPAESQKIPTESASLFVPVGEGAAWAVLLGMAAGFTLIGMWWFSTSDYRDEV